MNFNNEIIRTQDLCVSVGSKNILNNINMKINKNETHVLMGPNGAGKSTLGFALMGNPKYKIESGKIFFKGNSIENEPTYERAKMGMFLSFQTPFSVSGITLESFLRNALEQKTGKNIRLFDFKKRLAQTMELLEMDSSYAQRDLNVGFSGGEMKKSEILQMLMLEPKFAILDETDSGLDVDATNTVSKGIYEFKKNTNGSLLIITHNTKILQSLDVDYVHILVNGKIVKTGDSSLIDYINQNGFQNFE